MNAITFAFRKPRFPLICDLDGDVCAAQSAAMLQRRLGGRELPDDKKMRFVDSSGESWMFPPDQNGHLWSGASSRELAARRARLGDRRDFVGSDEQQSTPITWHKVRGRH